MKTFLPFLAAIAVAVNRDGVRLQISNSRRGQ
jgi:hypothetical protein